MIILPEGLSCIFGQASSGKTRFTLGICQHYLSKRIIFIDTTGTLHLPPAFSSLIVLKPTSFVDQEKILTRLFTLINDQYGLIVIDSFTHFYRKEVAEDRKEAVKQLNLQIGILSQLTKLHHIPILITSEVYQGENTTEPLGGKVLKTRAKALFYLQQEESKRTLTIIKHPDPSKEFISTELVFEQDILKIKDPSFNL